MQKKQLAKIKDNMQELNKEYIFEADQDIARITLFTNKLCTLFIVLWEKEV